MATGNVNTTTVDEFLPEIWSKEVIYAAVNSSVMAGLVVDKYDGDIKNEGDVVHVPLFSAVTIGDKATGAVTYTNYTESTVDITINKHKYFAFKVEDIAQVQSSPDLISGYSNQGGRGIAKTMDTDVSALIQTATITQNVGAINTAATAYGDITDAVIRSAIQLLDEAEAPEEKRYLIISPAQKNALLGIDKFVEANKIGDASVIRTGLFGQIYGVLVYISNNLPSTASSASVSAASPLQVKRIDCIMFQEQAFALATQLDPRVQSAYDIDHLATSVVGDVIYGVGVLVPTFAVEVRATVE